MPSLGNYDRLSAIEASKADIDQARVTAESVVNVNGMRLQFDKNSRDRMALVIKGLKSVESVEWKMADNAVITFTKAELQKLYAAAEIEAGRRVVKLHAKAQTLKQRIERGERVTRRDIHIDNW